MSPSPRYTRKKPTVAEIFAQLMEHPLERPGKSKARPTNEKPMPKDLPVYGPGSPHCPKCHDRLEFGTDDLGRTVEWCSCGRRYLVLKGREKLDRYGAGERRDAEIAKRVARQCEPPQYDAAKRGGLRYLETRE